MKVETSGSPRLARVAERREAHRRSGQLPEADDTDPLDGIVKQTANAITKGKTSDLAKARAIYDWIVENTVRDPDVKGCGLGDIRGMLEMKNLSGKCADLNALFVGLARASGLPARDLYGLRVAPSPVAVSRQPLDCAGQATSRPRSIAAPKCGPTTTDGFPSIPPTCGSSCSRRRSRRSPMPTSARRAKRCSDRGR